MESLMLRPATMPIGVAKKWESLGSNLPKTFQRARCITKHGLPRGTTPPWLRAPTMR